MLNILLLISALSYATPDLWYAHVHDSASVDIFYVCSTETSDWTNAQGDTVHFADPGNPAHRAALYGEMHGVDSLLNPSFEPSCTTFNFYAPYYRQATLEGLLRDTSLFLPRCSTATNDVLSAFDYYIRHLSHGRRFILMGYSQGGYAVVQLLKHLTPAQRRRMVAAYVIGYQVTADDARHPAIRPARAADDQGVTVCYNSVASNDAAIPVLSGQNTFAINPVNWQTDATPATWLFDYAGAADTLTATLDPTSRLLIVSGYKGNCPLIPFVGKPGNYHCLEIPLYYQSIRNNIKKRIRP